MQNSKKILIFSTAYYPFVGGAEVAIKEITDRLGGDFEFDLITARLDSKVSKGTFDRPERIGNVNVYRMGFGIPILDKLFLPFWGAMKTLKLNSKNHYDFYWCLMVTYASGAAYIANILSRKKVPIILTLQEGDSEEHFAKKWLGLINLSWRLALKRSALVTVISNYLGERARRLGYKGKIELIPNGVDIRKFESQIMNYELRKEVRGELGLEEKDTALVTTSRLNIKNGVGDVIGALKFLPDNVKFVIFGIGELEKDLRFKAKSLGVSERVNFRSFVSHDELPKYLKACDIFIRPSLSEGQGVSFMEAMAARLPVIATPVGGIVDFLRDSSNDSGQVATGYFCEPQSPESIAKTVNRVVDDISKNRIVDYAYKMVLERYDWDLIAKQMKEVFD